jgi:8-oxo-dGTP diphosphatase
VADQPPGPAPEVPRRKQRISARALLRRRTPAGVEEVLLARVSGTGYTAAGTWTLPGGGIDHGEHPEDSLRREVHEETGLSIEVRRILGVVSRHFTGLSPRGELEDFHGLHLVYDAVVVSESDEPRVIEVDGTTDAVAWVPVQQLADYMVAAVVGEALALADMA